MTLLHFPGLGSADGEWWLLTDSGQMVHATGAVTDKHATGVPVVHVQQDGKRIRDELLATSRARTAALAAAAKS